MPTIHTQVHSPLPPDEVLRILTDFGPTRSAAWPGVDEEHLTVHDRGPDWAEVTEGDDLTWERERYAWDAAAGTVSAVTLDSNVWAAGSTWTYALTRDATGTTIDVTLLRAGKGAKGRLFGALLPVVGPRRIKTGLAQALQTDR